MKTTAIHLAAKIKTYFSQLLILFFAFVAPIKALLFLCGMVIFVDLFLGVKKSIKQGKKITSKGLYETVRKMFIYQVTIISFYFIDVNLLGEFISIFIDMPLFLTKLVTVALVSVEVFSINENIIILWGVDIPERVMNVLAKFFSFKKKFDKYE
jgi:hypothetical protein